MHAEGKPLPTELRREETKLRHDVELEDDNTAVPRTHIDDEYAHAGERDPKILITTSRDPSTRLVSFAKEMKLVFPNAQRINRGGMVSAYTNRCGFLRLVVAVVLAVSALQYVTAQYTCSFGSGRRPVLDMILCLV